MFSKYFYLVSLTNYYTFYLIQKFNVSIRGPNTCSSCSWPPWRSARCLGVRSATASAASTSSGSPSSAWPLLAPAAAHVGLAATVLLTVPIGLILASAFPAILVYAQELVPGRWA
jgi:FSR family fosmidomycin resistance protein-like MFS transporter